MPNDVFSGNGFWVADDGSYGIGRIYVVEDPKLTKLLSNIAESEGDSSRYLLIREMLGDQIVTD